jgi:membrane protein DedA with SNARE-associated domain
LGKTLGASVVYYVADKLEDILSSKIGKFIGITHEQIEFFGSHLGRGMRDYVILIFLRALPIMPSSLISVGSGLLKVNFKLFVISTFIGSAIRDSIYIYLGYAGTKLVHEVFVKNMNSIELVFQVLVAVILVLVFIFLYYRRKKTKI